MKSRVSFVVAAFLVVVLGSSTLSSDECAGATCFRGKTISIVVGFGAGGGYDAYARMIAPELERLTDSTVVVRNRPGAGGLLALNEMARLPGDGLTLGMINVTAAVIAQGLKLEAARFDLADFFWLAGISPEERTLVMAADSPALPWGSKWPAGQPVRWAAGGQTDDMAVNASLLSEAFGLNARIVSGYRGTNEAVLGVIRGEADAVIISADSARRYVDSRAIKVAAVIDSSRSALFPDTPTLFEVAEGVEIKSEWIRLLINLSALGRGIAATPGTAGDRIDYLREALRKILTDEAFRRRAVEAGRNVEYQSPQDLTDIIPATMQAMKDEGRLSHVLLKKYH